MTNRNDKNDKHVLVLLSSMAGNRNQTANCDMSMTILRAKGLEPLVVDASDPDQKRRRDELFEISGIRGNFPQIFKVDGKTTTFIGDFDAFQGMNEDGSLSELASSMKPDNDIGSDQPAKPVRVDSVNPDEVDEEGSGSDDEDESDDDSDGDDEEDEKDSSLETIDVYSKKDAEDGASGGDNKGQVDKNQAQKFEKLIRVLLVAVCLFLIFDIVLVILLVVD